MLTLLKGFGHYRARLLQEIRSSQNILNDSAKWVFLTSTFVDSTWFPNSNDCKFNLPEYICESTGPTCEKSMVWCLHAVTQDSGGGKTSNDNNARLCISPICDHACRACLWYIMQRTCFGTETATRPLRNIEKAIDPQKLGVKWERMLQKGTWTQQKQGFMGRRRRCGRYRLVVEQQKWQLLKPNDSLFAYGHPPKRPAWINLETLARSSDGNGTICLRKISTFPQVCVSCYKY